MSEFNIEEIELRALRQDKDLKESGLVKFLKSCKANKALRLVIDLILCNLVRFFYVIESGFCIFYLINLTSNLVYLIILGPLLVIIVDDLYVSIKRKGK